jgi:hypothetical protein
MWNLGFTPGFAALLVNHAEFINWTFSVFRRDFYLLSRGLP